MNKKSTLLALLVAVSGCLVSFSMGNLSKHEHEYSAIVGYENTTTVWSKDELKKQSDGRRENHVAKITGTDRCGATVVRRIAAKTARSRKDFLHKPLANKNS